MGSELLRRDRFLLREVAVSSGVAPDSLAGTLPLLLGLHDVGKFSEGFQDLRPALAERLSGPRPRRPYGVRHDTLGASLLLEELARVLVSAGVLGAPGLDSRDAVSLYEPWLIAATGHHGEPPDIVPASLHFSAGARDAARSMALTFAGILGSSELRVPPGKEPESALSRSSWAVSGIAILADWLGSNRDYFPYAPDVSDPREYWALARARAVVALDGSGLGPFPPATSVSFKTLFPQIEDPSPSQRACAEAALGDGPVLAVVEDLTGSGKTEAALALAARLISTGRAAGIYFALPTMATANAMHARVSSMYRRLYQEDASPPLLLSHSAAHLGLEPRRDDPGATREATATSTAFRWLADSRKKALLAAVGVGTIDQALLAVLTSRHSTLRASGLGRNVLLVDEVHAFDPYQSSLLERLIEAQATMGGSVILLSATIPTGLRRRLVGAFSRGLGTPASTPTRTDYPLLTLSGRDGLAEAPVAARTGTPRQVPVRFVHEEDDVEAELIAAAEGGQCACWIRNTVKDAVRSYGRLKASLGGDRVILFHARFAMADRLRIEREVLASFGPDSSPESRRGRVVVATQVVEQSLDLDFDTLATDLAPIDLIIQRSGRLRRHPRAADGRRAPVEARVVAPLVILSPPWNESPGPGWLSASLRGTSFVYQDAGRLWLTMRALIGAGAIRVPQDARALVESVYGESGAAEIPAGLVDATSRAEGTAAADRSLARLNAVDLGLGYVRSKAWEDDRIVPTRLGEPSVTLRLGVVRDGLLGPLAAGSRPQAWYMSQVSARLVSVAQRSSVADENLVKAAEAEMPDGGDGCLTLVLRDLGEGLRCEALDGRGRAVTVNYSSVTGLAMERGGRGAL